MSFILSATRLLACLWLMILHPQKVQAKQHDPMLFVLFHGLGSHAATFSTLEKGLQKNFPSATIVSLSSVEGMQSLYLSTKEQVDANFQELKSRVENLETKSILLIGHSHGGIRAYTFLKKYENKLHIKGLVTLATPWEGAPGARVDTPMLETHLTGDALRDLRLLSVQLGHSMDTLEKQFFLEIGNNQMVALTPGAKDLIVGSELLSEIKQSLPSERTAILAIAGGQNDWNVFCHQPRKRGSTKRLDLSALNKMYNFFVTGTDDAVNGTHDMKIPCYSQHAEHIVPKNKQNFKRFFIKDAVHDTRVLGIMTVPLYKVILYHTRTLKEITRFAKETCKK